MKRKLVFASMVVLALVLTTGTFAFTYSNQSTTTMEASMANGDFATYQESINQPDWQRVLPNATPNTETLYPAADTCDIGFPTQFPNYGKHFEKVSDVSDVDLSAYISTLGCSDLATDLFLLTPFSGMGGLEKISSIAVYFRVASGGNYDTGAAGVVKIDDQVYQGPCITIHGANFTTKSWVCDTNPATGKTWTWNDINSIQAGVVGEGNSRTKPLLCTLVYVQVNYTYTSIQGAVPTGDLYDITPYPGYTGDLLVKIYITNTASLLKAYQYLNMKVFTAYSLEAGKTPGYQVLSMENGVVLFNIEGGSAAKYTVSICGGAYRLISDNPDEWGAGWSVAPEFYCEVAQR
jgi:hypothetical protein